ncbi:cytochrome P450 [Tricladium varicosporioides]|nr:cytochrome P450 [Hymenoscyphus varicosporioides]
MFISPLSLAVLCISVSWLIWRRHKLTTLSRSHGCQPPPRYAHKDPIFGLDYFIRNGRAITNNTFLIEYQERFAKYGRTFSFLAFGSGAIASIEPENLKTAWVTKFDDWGVQAIRHRDMEPFAGTGFISADGHEWERSRALLKPSFRKKNISDLEPFEKCLKNMLKQIPRDGTTVDLQDLFSKLYLDTATLFLFGESLGILEGKMPPHAVGFLDAFEKSFAGAGIRMVLGPLGVLLPKGKWLEACAKCHRFADYYVDKALEYREALRSNGDTDQDDASRQRVLLYNMAELTGDRIYLRNQILQAFMASQETTANLLGNIFFILARHSRVFEKLRAEVLSNDGPLDYNSLMKMKYLQNVISEVLRIHPVLTNLSRTALRDTILPVGGSPDGHSPIFVPRGTKLFTSFYALHRLPSIWGLDAAEFKPERWDTVKPTEWEYAPFSGGGRKCAGQQKAVLETSYVVVRMLQEFQMIESRDDRPWVGQMKLTVKNAHGCLVTLVPA